MVARAFSIGATSVLFSDADYTRWGTHRQYDVTPDGQRFILVRRVGGQEDRLILVRNVLGRVDPGARK